jgi:hypothetical protein
MMDLDVYANERLMYQRVDQDRRAAERFRIQREAGAPREGRLSQWATRVECELSYLLALARRSLDLAGPEPVACAD